MKKTVHRFYAGVSFALTFTIVYTLTFIVTLNLPRYYPTERLWKWSKDPELISMGWYGKWFFAAIAATLCSGIIGFMISKKQDVLSSLNLNRHKSVGFAAMIVILISLGFILIHEFKKWSILP